MKDAAGFFAIVGGMSEGKKAAGQRSRCWMKKGKGDLCGWIYSQGEALWTMKTYSAGLNCKLETY